MLLEKKSNELNGNKLYKFIKNLKGNCSISDKYNDITYELSQYSQNFTEEEIKNAPIITLNVIKIE